MKMTPAEATEAIAELLWPEGGAPEGEEWLNEVLSDVVAACVEAGYGPREAETRAA